MGEADLAELDEKRWWREKAAAWHAASKFERAKLGHVSRRWIDAAFSLAVSTP